MPCAPALPEAQEPATRTQDRQRTPWQGLRRSRHLPLYDRSWLGVGEGPSGRGPVCGLGAEGGTGTGWGRGGDIRTHTKGRYLGGWVPMGVCTE